MCGMQYGVDYAFGELPERLSFLKGLSQMCSRLPAKQADLLMSHMQQALAGRGQDPREDDPEWEDYWDFLALAKDRASKGAHPRSALKGRLSAVTSRPVQGKANFVLRRVFREGCGVSKASFLAASAHTTQLSAASTLHTLACSMLSCSNA